MKCIPFTYRVKCINTNEYYYGVKYAKNCKPSDLWSSYFTSSNIIKELILIHGKDNFIVEIRKIKRFVHPGSDIYNELIKLGYKQKHTN